VRVRFAGILTDRIIVQSCSRNGRRSYSNSCGGRGAGSNTSNTLRATALRSSSMPASLGWEGIVCMWIDLPYRPGPAKSWIKVKNKKHPALLRVKEAFELERQRYGK